MDQLNNIFALIKADLALAPTEDMERDLQQVTLTDNLTSLLERANVENVQEKVQDFVGDIQGLTERVEMGLSEFIN